MTTIKLKNGSGAPLAGDLVQGEPALDLTNKRLYTEDSGGTVIEVGTNPTSLTTGGLTVNSTLATINSSGPNVDLVLTESNTNTDARIRNSNGILEIDADLNNEFGSSSIMFAVDGTDKLKIDNNGDISFFENTGTTAKFFWDASAESLGVGTTTTTSTLNIQDGTPSIRFYDSNLVTRQMEINAENGNAIIKVDPNQTEGTSYYSVEIDATERMRIDASGNVDVGTESIGAGGTADKKIGVYAGGYNENNTASLVLSGGVGNNNTPSAWSIEAEASGTDNSLVNNLKFGTTSYTGSVDVFTERMRIDSSGSLLHGTTSSSIYNATSGDGVNIKGQQGQIIIAKNATSTADPALWLNNTGVDGSIVTFAKDGSAVGSIGTKSGNPFIANAATGIKFTNEVEPCDNNGADADTFVDLGSLSNRFGNLHLSGAIRCPDYRSEGVLFLTYDADDSLQIRKDNGAEAARFDSSGNLLVGTTSSTSMGTVNTGVVLRDNTDSYFARNTNGSLISFFSGSGFCGSISVSGSSTAYNTSSDQRLKDNIVDAPSASNDIDAIQVRSFDWKADGSHQKYGMVAQELNTVAPEAVSAPEDPEEMMGVDYSKLVPMMLKEIQSLRARVAQLEGAN